MGQQFYKVRIGNGARVLFSAWLRDDVGVIRQRWALAIRYILADKHWEGYRND